MAGRRRRLNLREFRALRDRTEPVESLWKQQYETFTSNGVTPRKAQKLATDSVAARFSVSSRRVQQLRKLYAEDVEPADREWRQQMRLIQPRLSEQNRKLDALRELLPAATLEEMIEGEMSTVAMEPIADLLLKGAAAVKRVAELEAENRKLRVQLAAAIAAPAYSAKRKSSR